MLSLREQLVPHLRLAVHHLFYFDVVARTAALDHVAGEGKRSAAEADHRQLVSPVLDAQANRLGNILQLRRAIGGEHLDVVGGAERLFDDRTFGGRKVEGQAHHLQRQQQVGKDDSGIHPQNLGGLMVTWAAI